MFIRSKVRKKDGKTHRYWSVVENVRLRSGRVVQRQLLSLGEINDRQRAAWCRSIEVLEGNTESRQVALFAEDREAPELEDEVIRIKVSELTLHDPRQLERLLVGTGSVGPAGAGSILGSVIACESKGHPLAGYPEGAGVLPSD